MNDERDRDERDIVCAFLGCLLGCLIATACWAFVPTRDQEYLEEIERVAHGLLLERTTYAGFVPFFCPTPIAMALHAAQHALESVPIVREYLSAASVVSARRP